MKFVPLKNLILSCIFAYSLAIGDSYQRESGALISLRQADTAMFQVGEELIYNVSYLSINIGQVKIRVVGKVLAEGESYYKAIAFIDSYSGIPFVNLHAIYESNIDEKMFSRWFRSRNKEDSRWYATEYDFNYQAGKMYIQKGFWKSNKIDVIDSLTLDTLYHDGLSLYYYARQFVRSPQRVVIPTMIREKKVRTIINFSSKHTKADIDAVAYPVDVIEFDGDAEFVGIFGLTGAFEGWFSNDDARIPILAKMKVIIGNIRIELLKWTRQGWSPPQYAENTSR